MGKRARSQGPVLAPDSEFSDVLNVLTASNALSEAEMNHVIATLKHSRPNGSVFLSCTSASELHGALGLELPVCETILGQLRAGGKGERPNAATPWARRQAAAAVKAEPSGEGTSSLRRSSRRRRSDAALAEHAVEAGEGEEGGDAMDEDGGEEEEAEQEQATQRSKRSRQLRVSSAAAQAGSVKAEPAAGDGDEDEGEGEQQQEQGQQEAERPGTSRGTSADGEGLAGRTRAARRQQAAAASEASGGGGGAVIGGVPGAGNRRWRPNNSEGIKRSTVQNRQWGLEEIFKLFKMEELHDIVGDPNYDLVDDITFHMVKRDGVLEEVPYKRVQDVAKRMALWIATGTLDEKDEDKSGWTDNEIKAFLRDRCNEQVKQYVDQHLKLQYAAVPEIRDKHALLWELWDEPVSCEIPDKVLLGTYTFNIASVSQQGHVVLDAVRRDNDDATISFRKVYEMVEKGWMELEDMDDAAELLFTNLNILTYQPSFWRVRAKVERRGVAGGRKVTIYVHARKPVLPACWTGKRNLNEQDEGEEEQGQQNEDAVYSVDLAVVLGFLDHLKGTEVQDRLSEVNAGYDDAADKVLDLGIDDRLEKDTPLGLKQFDRIMGLVENYPHDEPADLEERCEEAIALTLRPYQRRTIAFMLQEEQAQCGSARKLWVKVPSPEHPDLTIYASPILHQVRIYKSRIEAEQEVGACGGSGWNALQMGMGKTAAAVAAVILNPPPEDWRAERQWKNPEERDYLEAVTNNMPHGNTLIVAPPSLLIQWKDEVEKTAAEDYCPTVYDWGDRAGKADPRSVNCRELAEYDIVLTTPALATSKHILNKIYWHRIIMDEPQLGGFLADGAHRWFANHRWVMTGTPINASVDTIGPSLNFLRLGGGYSDAFKYLPPVMANVLQGAMVWYTKDGTIDGEQNLPLPTVTERTLFCKLDDEDRRFYNKEEARSRKTLVGACGRHNLNLDQPPAADAEYDYKCRNLGPRMFRLRKIIDPVRKSSGGAFKHKTGRQVINKRDNWVEETVLTASKADAVIEDLAELKRREPNSKVLIFSEWADALRQVQRRLKDIGLQHRSLLGGGGSATRGAAVRQFMHDPPTRVFLLTHRAGGAGITLTSANHVYLLEPCLNASFEKQAIGRTVRMGQNKPVTVTRVVMKGTIEERLVGLLERKRADEVEAEADAFASTAAEANPAANDAVNKLSIADLNELLRREQEEEEESEGMEDEY